MDDEHLKNPGGWDYFDALLAARIREIRASEKRFYQKVHDLFALSSDYQFRQQETQIFFAEAQNKLLFAVAGKTAAELIFDRANPDLPNMALTTWSSPRVRYQFFDDLPLFCLPFDVSNPNESVRLGMQVLDRNSAT